MQVKITELFYFIGFTIRQAKKLKKGAKFYQVFQKLVYKQIKEI